MERLLIKRETLTKIADEVRALSGSTAQLSTDEMVELIEKSKQEMVTVTVDGVGVSTTFYYGDGRKLYEVPFNGEQISFQVPIQSIVFSTYPIFDEDTTIPDPDEHVRILNDNLIIVSQNDVHFRVADGAPM